MKNMENVNIYIETKKRNTGIQKYDRMQKNINRNIENIQNYRRNGGPQKRYREYRNIW